MSSDVDYYDVQRMIEEEASRLRGRIDNLRADVNAALDELREQIGAERVDRQDALESVVRMVNSRTEHLA